MRVREIGIAVTVITTPTVITKATHTTNPTRITSPMLVVKATLTTKRTNGIACLTPETVCPTRETLAVAQVAVAQVAVAASLPPRHHHRHQLQPQPVLMQRVLMQLVQLMPLPRTAVVSCPQQQRQRSSRRR